MDVGARYLELILRLRRLAPSLVDSYVGSPELAARGGLRSLIQISDELPIAAWRMVELAPARVSAIARIAVLHRAAAWRPWSFVSRGHVASGRRSPSTIEHSASVREGTLSEQCRG